MECLEVGKVKEQFKGLPDGISACLTEGGIMLLASYNSPADTEVENYKSGNIEFKLITMGDLVWMLVKVGSEEWSDMPVHIDEECTLDDVLADLDDEMKGYSVSVVLADTITGEVKALRLLGLGNKFSKSLNKMMRKVTPITNNADLLIRARNVQAKYSTKHLVKLSNTGYISGTIE